jgi:hypothetical protein
VEKATIWVPTCYKGNGSNIFKEIHFYRNHSWELVVRGVKIDLEKLSASFVGTDREIRDVIETVIQMRLCVGGC